MIPRHRFLSAAAWLLPLVPGVAFADETPPAGPSTSAADGSAEPNHDDRSGLARDGHPMAGWHNGLFYLRDHDDNFRLYLQGRAQIDFYGYAGSGASETGTNGVGQALKPTIFLRRIRPELSGELLHDFSFMLAGDWGTTALDNANGAAVETRAAKPGAAPGATTGSYASAQTPKLGAQPTDVFVNWHAGSMFNAQVGQFDANFTMENRTSDKYFPWMERSLAVRDVGIPTNKEIGAMLWGETPGRFWFYSVGLYNGDGQNRLNTDSSGDLMLRTFIHPLASAPGIDRTLRESQIGGSFRTGARDHNFAYSDYNAMTTQGNYTFWKPVYTGSNGTTHILPSGAQLGLAGELRVPISIVDLTSEFVYIENHTRESLEGYQPTESDRFGDMKGYSYYVQVGFWPVGKRDIQGPPGYENVPHLSFDKPDPESPPQALQLLVKWEQLALTYASASRGGAADAKNVDGDIKVNAFSLGANYWFTKHLRLSANYVLSMFPDSAPTSPTNTGGPVQSSKNRAIAPGNTLDKGVNDDARDNAHAVHEILTRFAVAF